MALRSLALWCCLAAAGALRQLPLCEGLVNKNVKGRGGRLALAFPLNVEGLLGQFDHNKTRYFQYLRNLGINDNMHMAVPTPARHDCLGKNSYSIFMGDSMMSQAYFSYLRLGTNGTTDEQLAGGVVLDRTAQPPMPMILDGEEMELEYDPRANWQYLSSNTKYLEDKQVRGSYLRSLAADVALIKRDLREMVAHVRQTQPSGVKIVLWINILLHGFMSGQKEWLMPERRKARQLELVTFLRQEFPEIRFIWDTPSFVDVPLMKAWPEHPEAKNFEEKDAMHVTARLAQQDLLFLPSLGVPLSSRWAISNKYRGLQCDGIHASGIGRQWGCPGFYAYEDLVLQSGLEQLCLKRRPRRLCS